ncbi:MAG: ATP-binding protein [Chitinophagaceae bacterium]
MPVQKYQIITLIVVVIIVLIIACFFIFILVAFANQRKKRYQEEKILMSHNFQQELLKTQLEIQEQTLNNISQEIHDNIGQVLSLAKINLATLDDTLPAGPRERVADTRVLIGTAIQDLRDLAKTINADYIKELGLLSSVETELDIIRKTGLFKTNFEIIGTSRKLAAQKELILFRIVQELINNTIKHSNGSLVSIRFTFETDRFEIYYQDNGKGFDPVLVNSFNKAGLGMKNIRNRATMIEAEYRFDSEAGTGTSFHLSLKD